MPEQAGHRLRHRLERIDEEQEAEQRDDRANDTPSDLEARRGKQAGIEHDGRRHRSADARRQIGPVEDPPDDRGNSADQKQNVRQGRTVGVPLAAGFKDVDQRADHAARAGNHPHALVREITPQLDLAEELPVDPDRNRTAQHDQIDEREELIEPDEALAERPLPTLVEHDAEEGRAEQERAFEHFGRRRAEEGYINEKQRIGGGGDRDDHAERKRKLALHDDFVADEADFHQER